MLKGPVSDLSFIFGNATTFGFGYGFASPEIVSVNEEYLVYDFLGEVIYELC